jgi:hypothetical protein
MHTVFSNVIGKKVGWTMMGKIKSQVQMCTEEGHVGGL